MLSRRLWFLVAVLVLWLVPVWGGSKAALRSKQGKQLVAAQAVEEQAVETTPRFESGEFL